MNCKQGDMAFVMADSRVCKERTAGAVVKVMHFLGGGRHTLPDGTDSNSVADSWCIKFPRKLRFKKGGGGFNLTRYASCSDAYLRPIRPGDISDEEVRDLYAPKIPEAA